MSNLPGQLIKQTEAPVLRILTGSNKGKQFRLLSSSITIGRHYDCDVIFKDDPKCSRQHAKIKKEEGIYLIESLNPTNLVLVNKKPITTHTLKSKDKITIGNVEMLFLEKSAPAPIKQVQPSKVKKNWLNPPRLILLIACIAGAALYFSEDKKTNTEEKLSIKTEAEILKEVEDIESLNKEEDEKKALSSQEKAAKTAFIKGFRDYRKGYFHRALKIFQHCLTLNKANVLCQSYTRKSKTQIDILIQKKIRLGNAYKKNKQYEACRAAFKSVEIMIQDSKSPVYKEASANKKLCEIQLKNKI